MRTLELGDLTNLTEARPGGNLLWVSFDVSGSLGGINFDDEDILEFDPSGPTWSLVYEGSAVHAALAAADVVAVPEPRGWLQLVTGMGLLVALRGASRRRLLDTHSIVYPI